MDPLRLLRMGQIAGVFGVRGWIKVHSFAQPEENILKYEPWILSRGDHSASYKAIEGKRHGKSLIVRLEGIGTREEAAALAGMSIAVAREQLPSLAEDEFYWADLIGLTVETESGIRLGSVAQLIETGSNDVLVVKGGRERLIPFIQPDVVKRVDLAAAKMIVDWDPDF